MPKESVEKFLGHYVIESPIKLSLADRVRVIFGSQIHVQIQVHTRWRGGDHQTEGAVHIEQIFSRWGYAFRQLMKKWNESKPEETQVTN